MMGAHLLSLSALHAAAPGVLDVIFGADGDFEGAPMWHGPINTPTSTMATPVLGWLRGNDAPTNRTDPAFITICGSVGVLECWLDLRIPSVAARLAGLCNRAMLLGDMDIDNQTAETFARAMRGTARGWAWSVEHASRLAALTLSLAPRIAALRSPA